MNKSNKTLQKAITVSYTLLGSLALFGIIGYYLKNKFYNDYLLIVFLILGAIIGLYEMFKQLKK
tara:strand:- start:155 stop:346 length:192 start_codon:yes stop_codon:yes gene_type:complete